MPPTAEEARHPGAHAASPWAIPPRGWWQIAVRAGRRSATDRVPLMAAGVAFFSFLALFPSLIATILVYGLVSDPEDITGHLETLAGVLPQVGVDLVEDQMDTLVAADRQGLGLGLAVSVLVALWSASLGIAHLISAVNAAYEQGERVGFVKRRAMALVFTGGAMVLFVVVMTLVAVFPAVVALGGVPRPLLNVGRWLVLLAVLAVSLGAVYRFAPERRSARVPWVSVGALVATAIWLAASAGFSLYITYLGSYAETYGALAGVVVILLWMWLSAMAVLFGAEVNAEAEHQTDVDSTVGEPRPRGERGAVKADAAVGRPPESED
ncbi:YihY/virulence factor BrkB family protein [Actinotalea sp. BY-33]|uniref:YihY/virulence factor BrkB family protein n=1 Tax=Actinotalea soli TaxID=2819234 RepID=A0A939LN66_9CELL|nr:YihY/virulence factor BrkB family protein [Actinotalea soli]MBO1750781.1 YihY/virulence factor BrkB family protein [Actinotalea soli]